MTLNSKQKELKLYRLNEYSQFETLHEVKLECKPTDITMHKNIGVISSNEGYHFIHLLDGQIEERLILPSKETVTVPYISTLQAFLVTKGFCSYYVDLNGQVSKASSIRVNWQN